MRVRGAVTPELRAEILRQLRDTERPVAEIAARAGIQPGTVYALNARAGWPRPRRWRWPPAARWPEARRAALARLLRVPLNDPGDVAEVGGLGRSRGPRLRAAYGQDGPSEHDPEPAFDPPTLRAHLRVHIARQIAAYDLALSADGAAAESGRVLRDLGGLKRLLDEVDAGTMQTTGGEGGDGGSERDLPALRAEIARRYAGFVGGGAPA